MEIKEESIWLKKQSVMPKFPVLTEHISADIVIIGAGLTGIITAYTLSSLGRTIVMIEKEGIKNSETAYTTAFLTYIIDTQITELINLFGKDQAKLVWQSHNAAIDEIEHIVETENIRCEFTRCNEYIYAKNSHEFASLKSRQKLAHTLGFLLNMREEKTLSFSNAGSLEIPKQAKFQPINYALAVREKALEHGVLYFEQTQATRVKRKEDKFVIVTNHGEITASDVIIATYDPFNHPKALFAKKGMYKTFVLQGKVAKGIMHEGLYLDMNNPYHYTRIDHLKDHDRFIVGGEDHRNELPYPNEKSFAALKLYIEHLLPKGSFILERKWPGLILEPSDGLALIGKLSHGLYVATAFSGNGMTYAHIAARIFSDLIQGKQNPYQAVYNPTRIPTLKQLVEKGRDYVEEFFGGAVKDLFT